MADRSSFFLEISEKNAKNIFCKTRIQLGEAKTIAIEEGKYHAQIRNALGVAYHAEGNFEVPTGEKVVFQAKKAESHALDIKVVDEKGQAVKNVGVQLHLTKPKDVWARLAGDDGERQQTLMTNEEGRVHFRLKGKVPEKCSVSITDPSVSLKEGGSVSSQYWDSQHPWGVTVSRKKDNGTIKCFLKKDRRLSFKQKPQRVSCKIRVTAAENHPVEGAVVKSSKNDKTTRGKTNAEGISSMKLPLGKCRLEVMHDLYHPKKKEIRVNRGMDEITIEMEKFPVIEGKVTYKGTPVKNNFIQAWFGPPMTTTPMTRKTDKEGHYAFPLKRTGRFTLAVPFKGVAEHTKKITHRKGESSRNKNIRLLPRFQAELTLDQGWEGLTEKKGKLILLPEGKGAFPDNASLPQDKTEAFTVNVTPGRYDAYIIAVDADDVSEGGMSQGANYNIYDMNTVNLQSPEQVPVLRRDKDKGTLRMRELRQELKARWE